MATLKKTRKFKLHVAPFSFLYTSVQRRFEETILSSRLTPNFLAIRNSARGNAGKWQLFIQIPVIYTFATGNVYFLKLKVAWMVSTYIRN